jgi:hypothetical protein
MKESNSSEILVEEEDEAGFKEIIQFLYTGSYEFIDSKKMINFIFLCNKYLISSVEDLDIKPQIIFDSALGNYLIELNKRICS